jgi:hypothetical protein
MSELLCYLRDGACCTLLLVKAPAQKVAEALGRAAPLAEARLGIACELGSTGWTRVELASCVELELAHPALAGYEAIVLLREAIPVVRGEAPDTPPCFETPVSTAAMLSRTLGSEAVAVWASDQGEGIGGVAEFTDGRPTAVLTTSDPEKLEALLERHSRDDEDENENGGDFEHEERHYVWPRASYADGEFDEAADSRLAAMGFDLELLGEPLWSLTEGGEPHSSLGACFGIA